MARKTSTPRIVLILLLAVASLVFGAFSFVRRIDSVEPVVGVEWLQTSAGPLALMVDDDGAAGSAGLREGDVLIAVDGREVHSALDAAEIGWGQRQVRLDIRRGTVDLSLTVDVAGEHRQEPYAYLALVGLAFWVAGLFIGLRWPGVRGATVFTLLALVLSAQLLLSHTGRADTADWAIYWTEILAAALTPSLLLHFSVAVTRRTLVWRRAVLTLAYTASAGLVLAALWLSPSTLGGAYRFDEPRLALEFRDRMEVLLLALALLLSAGILVKAYQRTSSALQRTQLRWLLRGVTFGFGPFVLLYAVPWALSAPELPNWAQLVSVVPLLFVPAAFTAALVRYRLHDLDLILLRGISEVAAVFCAFGVYAVAVFLLREWIIDLLGLSRSASRYIGLLCMAVAYPNLRLLVRTGVEKAFYRKRYSYRATLLDWARALTADTDLSSLLQRLKRRIRETLGVARAEVLIRTGEREFVVAPAAGEQRVLRLEDEALGRLRDESFVEIGEDSLGTVPWARYLFAMKVKGDLRAVLAVAEREAAEEPLNTEDRALLGTLAAHLATAIEAARLVDEVRRRAAEIERLHARQETILESSAVGLLLLDTEGRIQAWNRALEEIYGLDRAEALGRGLADVFPLHVVRRLESETSFSSRTGESRIFRLSLVNRRGQRVIANLAISAVDGGSGEDGARVVTFDDVSERVKLEEQVLQQERLASLGLLAAGMAHEINTPLTGISSYAQMLIEECAPDDRRRDVLEKIEQQTQRAAKITGSLLNLARPGETVVESVAVADTVQEVLQLFEPQVRGRGIRLQVEVDEPLPTVLGHKGKLQQVLLNLLLNARDAVGASGEIRVRARRGGADKVLIEIWDNGQGIAEDDLPSIFDPFFTTKGRGRGTGLGLSIAYGIIQEHHGDIGVESRPGEFTRFRVELPAARSAQALA